MHYSLPGSGNQNQRYRKKLNENDEVQKDVKKHKKIKIPSFPISMKKHKLESYIHVDHSRAIGFLIQAEDFKRRLPS